ncbi:Crp/Fnr family transcriptional regulator [Sphingosinicella rhizophila]|uniref:Crp/Fnr family transcriptional regulator n=1 Tax=Sphingosinicella rhizophila TaxID=3050082 RepID=A0ABU3QA06_9SPHN|nr:Crp/Fnr family transcriptional regulator [Sphingosinicella sp. GR2756]MDT9600243.1 Crp/Fnr family transcriptional regulator [Sphingosinicella sp. GR2756]
MSHDELQFVRAIKTGERLIPARANIMAEDDPDPGISTIFSGWAIRYKTIGHGRRQVLDILLPGDLIGLQSEMTGKMRHSIRAVTEVRVCSLNSARFHDMFTVQPALSEALVATLLVEEHRADTRLLLLGQQRPTERLGWFLLELRERLQRRGEMVDEGFDLPLSYEQLSDTIGVSRSQIGASLRDMKSRGWARLQDRRLTFVDAAKMTRECEYSELPDPSTRTLI